jgi:hypothetical protein
MITMHEAVERAFTEFRSLYGEQARDPLLEEIEHDRAGNRWNVTIGFNVLTKVPATTLDRILAQAKSVAESTGDPISARYASELQAEKDRLERKYKTFQIDAESGELVRMVMAKA